jgi:hypothetical protein
MYSYFSSKLNQLTQFNHLNEKRLTYTQHFNSAFKMSYKMTYGGVCLLMHAIYPDIHQNTGSMIIEQLYLEKLTKDKKEDTKEHTN